MDISYYISDKKGLGKALKTIIEDEFELPGYLSESISKKVLQPHFKALIDTIWAFIEYPYVDKVYRDSYYHYFSSKLGDYKKDCIRISFFAQPVEMSDFRDPRKEAFLQENYLGFMVIRPTGPNVVGRSVISPRAMQHNAFLSCTVAVPASVKGVKLYAHGFPHSSQDTETISCAETTLWSIMEYFGHRYAEYSPVLPSRILNTLRRVSTERQIPSRGLNVDQIAYALKEFGFGTVIHSREQFGQEFFPLLSTYVESGIPVVVAIGNLGETNGSIAHAMLCIGHEEMTDELIDSIRPDSRTNTSVNYHEKRIRFFDYDRMKKDFIFIDDNLPVFQRATLEKPAMNYKDPEWKKCRIDYFVVPLHRKIYLEAKEGKGFVKEFIITYFYDELEHGSEILLRFFLASSRSLKHSVAHNVEMNEVIKDFIVDTAMPKFVWVAEISTKALLKDQKGNGLIILDATEANLFNKKPLIFVAFCDKIVTFGPNGEILTEVSFEIGTFNIYSRNLGGF